VHRKGEKSRSLVEKGCSPNFTSGEGGGEKDTIYRKRGSERSPHFSTSITWASPLRFYFLLRRPPVQKKKRERGSVHQGGKTKTRCPPRSEGTRRLQGKKSRRLFFRDGGREKGEEPARLTTSAGEDKWIKPSHSLSGKKTHLSWGGKRKKVPYLQYLTGFHGEKGPNKTSRNVTHSSPSSAARPPSKKRGTRATCTFEGKESIGEVFTATGGGKRTPLH